MFSVKKKVDVLVDTQLLVVISWTHNHGYMGNMAGPFALFVNGILKLWEIETSKKTKEGHWFNW